MVPEAVPIAVLMTALLVAVVMIAHHLLTTRKESLIDDERRRSLEAELEAAHTPPQRQGSVTHSVASDGHTGSAASAWSAAAILAQQSQTENC